jgi:hypothetical protein
MCDFVSWMEKTGARGKKTVVFLTTSDAREALKHEPVSSDNSFSGHGAIRAHRANKHISLDGAAQRETDSVAPASYPKEIVSAIKKGQMKFVGINEALLTRTAMAAVRREWRATEAWHKRVVTDNTTESEDRPHNKRRFIERHNAFWNAFKVKANRRLTWR